jgi:hypothetical protein
MPNVVHDIQFLAATLVLLSAHKEIDGEAVNFIMIGVLRVDGVAVDSVHDVIGREEVICTAAKRTPGEVEVDYLVLAHGLVLEINPEEVDIIVSKLVTNTRRKLFQCGLQDILLRHPFERADTILILKEHHRGIELENYLTGVIVSERHQVDKSKLLTNLL